MSFWGTRPSPFTSSEVAILTTIAGTTYTDGQLLIGNSSTGGLSVATLVQGANVTITNGNGTITIASTGGSSSGLTVGSTTIASGTNTYIEYNNSGVLGEYSISGTGTVVAMATSPSFTTPAIGAATGTSLVLTNTSATGFAVGRQGATNPVFAIDSSVASQADGIVVQGGAAGGGTTITATSSGANSGITIKGIGTGSTILDTSSTSGVVNLRVLGGTKVMVNSTTVAVSNIFTVTPAAQSAVTTRLLYTGAADTALTAGTEAISGYLNAGQTRQHASNTTVTLQRDFRVTGSTHSFVTAGGTITDVATFAVDGAPSAGTNAAITNAHGLYIPTIAVAGTITNAYGITVAAPTGASGNNIALNVASGHVIIEGVTSTGATGTGAFVFATSPTLVTPTIGAATATSVNGLALTALSTGFSVAGGTTSRTLTVSSNTTISMSGTLAGGGTSQTFTMPSTTDTIAGLGTTQTFTGQDKFNNIIDVNNAVTVTTNAGTVPITFRLNTFTNSSASAMTITMATASAVDGQMTIVRIYDFSAVTEGITWVNTENSTVTAPATSNGSTTLPLTVGFMYNSATSKWRCIASA